MYSITVKIDEELKRRMAAVRINWSEYIRDAIRRKIEMEERRMATERLLQGLGTGKNVVPSGFINETIREMREAR